MARAVPKTPGPLAFLSDIHGNLEALAAVLDDLAQRDVKRIHVVGDILLGGPAPLEVWRRLEQAEAICIRGLSDTALASVSAHAVRAKNDAERDKLAAFLETRAKVGDLVLERLRRLPERHRIPLLDGREIVMVHGSPVDPATEIGHEVTDEELLALLDDDPADVFVVGGTHVPFHRVIENVHILGAGSVGESPAGRIADVTLVTPSVDGPDIEQYYVEY
jgi:predicted phosphodiesterase